jgi:hypothetical protein
LDIKNLNDFAVLKALSLIQVRGSSVKGYLAMTVIALIITFLLSSPNIHVQQGFGQESTPSETILSGENLDLTVTPELPIGQAAEGQNIIVLFFNAKADD